MRKISFWSVILVFVFTMQFLEAADTMKPLEDKEQKLVEIAMYTARGNMSGLKGALRAGLDAGLTVNEIKEVLVQLYAYCGFPRSLNALGSFMALLQGRPETAPGGETSGENPGRG